MAEAAQRLTAAIADAQARNDWTASAACARELRDAFPQEPFGYEAGILALRRLRQFNEAEALLTEAKAKFPGRASLDVEAVRNSLVRRDWDETLQRAARLRRSHPQQVSGYDCAITALRELQRTEEAETLLMEARARFADRPWIAVQAVRTALAAGNWQETLRRAQLLRQHYPKEAAGYDCAVSACCRLRRFGEADATLSAAKSHLGPAALERMAGEIRAAREFSAADERLLENMRAQPAEARTALEYALLPSVTAWQKVSGGRAEALRRLEDIVPRFPQFDDGYIAWVQQLHQVERFEAADAVLASEQLRLERSEKLGLLWAQTAAARNLHDEARARFRRVRAAFPDSALALAGDIRSRIAQLNAAAVSQRAAAEHDCRAAMERFPRAVEFFELYGRIAHGCGDFAAAQERLLAAKKRFPNQRQFDALLLDTQISLGASIPSVGRSEASGGTDHAALMMRFQSLGSVVNGCEFGLVQRHFGAEPLGVLRWAGCPVEGLVNGLRNRFEGVGSESDTTIAVSGTGTSEYVIRSARYQMTTHTTIYTNQMAQEACLAQMRRRLAFLARKFREDLESRDSIFVYKSYPEFVSTADLQRILDALRAHGDHTLLVVQLAERQHPSGTLELAHPGLMLGYLDRFHKSAQNVEHEVQFDAWLAVCAEAFRRWQADRPAGAA